MMILEIQGVGGAREDTDVEEGQMEEQLLPVLCVWGVYVCECGAWGRQ